VRGKGRKVGGKREVRKGDDTKGGRKGKKGRGGKEREGEGRNFVHFLSLAGLANGNSRGFFFSFFTFLKKAKTGKSLKFTGF